jgi:hypothetical protein
MDLANGGGRSIASVLAAATAMLLVGQMAWAGDPHEAAGEGATLAPSPHTAVSTVTLHGGTVPKIAIFDATDSAYEDLPWKRPFPGGPCMGGKHGVDGYSPVLDGGIDVDGDGLEPGMEQYDPFDGGLYVEVNGQIFQDSDGMLAGEQLTTSDRLDGFRVVRIDQALASGPILRSLVMISNPRWKSRTAIVTIDSALGADDAEDTRASSSGNTKFTTKDRWFVTSDDPVTPGDTPVVFAVSGVGAPVHLSSVVWAPEDDSSAFCEGAVVFRYQLQLRARHWSTLMLFTELQDTNANAITAANKYDMRPLPAELVAGLTASEERRIVNFDV